MGTLILGRMNRIVAVPGDFMLQRLEERNREIWEGHPRMLQDIAHVLGGVGLGLLLYPVLLRASKSIGYTMLLLSTGAHFYADTVKPGRSSGAPLRAAGSLTGRRETAAHP